MEVNDNEAQPAGRFPQFGSVGFNGGSSMSKKEAVLFFIQNKATMSAWLIYTVLS